MSDSYLTPEPNITAPQLELKWQHARKTFLRRMTIMALFMVCAFAFLALFIQNQQREQDAYIQTMCRQRQINALKTNATWQALAEIERHNTFIDDKIRLERLTVYDNAQIVVPNCFPK